MGHGEVETYSFYRACYNHAELQQRVQDAWDNLSQDDIRHLYGRLHVKNTRLGWCQRAVPCVLIWLFGHHLLWCVLRLLWIYHHIAYSYNDKQPVTSVFSTLNLSLQMLHFCFPVVLFFQFIIRVIVYLILSVNIHIVYVLESSMIGGKCRHFLFYAHKHHPCLHAIKWAGYE